MKDLEKFIPLLRKGERVEWTGRPSSFPVVEPYNKKSLYFRWILTPVLAILCMVAYIVYVSARAEVSFSIVIPILIVLVAAFFILRPFTDARTLHKKRIYAVTSQRVIIYESDSSQREMELDSIDAVKFVKQNSKTADVMFGQAAIQKKYSGIRVLSIVPQKSSEDGPERVIGMAFYHVENYDKIRPLLAAGTKITDESLTL